MSQRKLLIIGAATALIAGIAITSPVQAAPRNQLQSGTLITEGFFGMHISGAESGVWPTIPFGSLRIWDKDTSWSRIEQQPGVFTWDVLDGIVDRAEKEGVKDLMMVLAGTPAWASKTPNSTGHPGQLPGEQGMPTDIALWDRWVEQVVTRYQGRITSYQPWNEANLQFFFNGTPAEMAELTKRTYDIVKRIDPSATVVAPSTGLRLRGPFRNFYPAFLRELGARGWPVDVFSAHTYPAGTGTLKDRQELATMWVDALQAAGAPKKPLWDTEINFGLAGPGNTPRQDIAGAKAQAWTARAYLDSLRLGISRAYWYYWSNAPEPILGIQMTPGTPASRAYQTLEEWLIGARFDGCRNRAASRVVCNFRKDGRRFQIVWSETGRRAFKALKSARQVCDLNNNCKPVRKNRVVRTVAPKLIKR